MGGFFTSQLDFIFFFYGLAFILLGITCWAIGRHKDRESAWLVLGIFGLTHGLSEWLDLTALIVGDAPAFAAARTALMAGSFLFLMEFARLEALRFKVWVPGRWIYMLLVLGITLLAIDINLKTAGIAARYAIGFIGSVGAGLALVQHARELTGRSKWFAGFAALGFMLYALATGLVVPEAPFWPANVINYPWFTELTGAPVQLFRGLLACWLSFWIWAIWGQRLASETSSPHFADYIAKQFSWLLVAMLTIVVSGWTLTEYLGRIQEGDMQQEADSDVDLLASRLTSETATIDGMVKALAGSPSILPALTAASGVATEAAQSVLELDVDASGAKLGLILDRSGGVVLSSDPKSSATEDTAYGATPYFQQSIAGNPGYMFAFDPETGTRNYYASQPIRSGDGSIVGVAVLAKSLTAFEADLRRFDRPYFFIDPNGVVTMTNRPEALLRTLWPLSAETKASLAAQYGAISDQPMLQQEITDATWTKVDGERAYVRHQFADHSQWSLVILKPTRQVFASRLMGIVITLLVTIMSLIYVLGRQRWAYDQALTDHRTRLQELARDLGEKATTDPLTGLNNRLMLEQTLASEISRSARYDSPLSLVLFDIDHFKNVNDTYGHLAGDKVLTQLAHLVPNFIRSSDFLARWGGEEFLIVLPSADGSMAMQAAEKLRGAIGNMIFEDVGTVTCSFGVTQYAPWETLSEFIARADEALYRAKLAGRNRVELAPPPDVTTGRVSTIGRA